MALGIDTSSGSGDQLPIVKYDARAGRMIRVDRSQTSDGWQSTDVDITNNATFIMDLANIEVGWQAFISGKPSFVMVPLGQTLPPKPTEEHRQGFRVRLFSKNLLDGVREFSHAAKCVIQVVDQLHTTFTEAPEAKAGKVPVVRLSGTTPVKTQGPTGTTTNYAPQFDIVKWVDRPAEFPLPGAKAAGNGAASNGKANGNGKHVEPPREQATTADDTEF